MPRKSCFSTMDGSPVPLTEIVAKEAKNWTESKVLQRESADCAEVKTYHMLKKFLSSSYVLF